MADPQDLDMNVYIVGPREPTSSETSEQREARSGELAKTSAQLVEEQWAAETNVAKPPYDLKALADLYETNSTNKACVDAKVINTVGLGWQLMWVGEKGKQPEKPEQDTDYQRLHMLFSATNEYGLTFDDVIRAVATDREAVGNGYLEISRDGLGKIDHFYHIPAETVRVLRDRTGFVQMREAKKVWFRNVGEPRGESEDYPERTPEVAAAATELLHFRKYTPTNTYYGIPDIVAAVAACAGDRAAREYNVDFFEHNCVPRMVLIIEGGTLSKELMEQIEQYMTAEIKGQGHKTLILDVPGVSSDPLKGPKIRFEPLTVGVSEDASFLGYRRANRDEILMVHRVPPSKITIVENANLANSRDQDKTFWEQVIRPEQHYYEGTIRYFVIQHETGLAIANWALDFIEADLTDQREDAEVARIRAQAGTLDQNEERAAQGLSPFPGLDEPLVGKGLIPLSQVVGNGATEPPDLKLAQEDIEGLAKALIEQSDADSHTWEDEDTEWGDDPMESGGDGDGDESATRAGEGTGAGGAQDAGGGPV